MSNELMLSIVQDHLLKPILPDEPVSQPSLSDEDSEHVQSAKEILAELREEQKRNQEIKKNPQNYIAQLCRSMLSDAGTYQEVQKLNKRIKDYKALAQAETARQRQIAKDKALKDRQARQLFLAISAASEEFGNAHNAYVKARVKRQEAEADASQAEDALSKAQGNLRAATLIEEDKNRLMALAQRKKDMAITRQDILEAHSENPDAYAAAATVLEFPIDLG